MKKIKSITFILNLKVAVIKIYYNINYFFKFPAYQFKQIKMIN